MEIVSILAGIAALLCCIMVLGIAVHLWLCKKRLHQHPHINPLDRALPVHASLVHQLVQDLANIANIDKPEIFVYRAALPNAFVAAMPLQSGLYIADELFEEANDCTTNPLQTLANTLAHELAHLKQQHAAQHAFYTYLSYINTLGLTSWAKKRLSAIEHDADTEAESIMRVFNQAAENSPKSSTA